MNVARLRTAVRAVQLHYNCLHLALGMGLSLCAIVGARFFCGCNYRRVRQKDGEKEEGWRCGGLEQGLRLGGYTSSRYQCATACVVLPRWYGRDGKGHSPAIGR